MIKPAPTLQQGVALVITGPQGSGKSMLARELAERAGAYREIDVQEIGCRFTLSEVLSHRPNTIVIDGAPTSEHQFALIKDLLANPSATVNRKHFAPFKVPRPHVILCLQDDTPLKTIERMRRFDVFRMPAVA